MTFIYRAIDKYRPQTIWILIGISACSLFIFSSLRHGLFRSAAWDLGIFDQAVYLIAQGQQPISSFTNFHILGDHASFILYPLALLYLIRSDVHWLLLVQAIALSLGAYPTWRLSLLADLSPSKAILAAVIYLLYPLVFNVNLFDFHPETIALPAILWSVLAARSRRIGQFCVAIAMVLSCKAVLSLTIAAMGLWLIFFEKRKLYGAIALFAGIAWFAIATQVIIPSIGGEGASLTRHLHRYHALGNSFTEIFANFFWQPQLALGQIFSSSTLEYAVLLFAPVIYIFVSKEWRSLLQLIPAIPTVVMNVLSSDAAQRNLVHQYSLPIVPFLILTVISSLRVVPPWLNAKIITGWAILGFLVLSRLHFFLGAYWQSSDTWQANREAIARIQDTRGVLTTAEIAPHLTHRSLVKLATTDSPSQDLDRFNYVLLNLRHPGWMSNQEFTNELINQLRKNPRFQLNYEKDDVYLFVKN